MPGRKPFRTMLYRVRPYLPLTFPSRVLYPNSSIPPTSTATSNICLEKASRSSATCSGPSHPVKSSTAVTSWPTLICYVNCLMSPFAPACNPALLPLPFRLAPSPFFLCVTSSISSAPSPGPSALFLTLACLIATSTTAHSTFFLLA